jgi:transposase
VVLDAQAPGAGSWEYFGWRRFHTRTEVAALAGLTPRPYASGDSARDPGISKAGNRRIRTLMLQIAWGWLRYHPHAALSVWCNTRFALGGKRMRRMGSVALARRLLVALWRYVQSGTIPESASLKPL